jgi:DtxR family Mn-dependent transcriptional regulator
MDGKIAESADISATMRDYLAEIYRLSDRARDFNTTDGFIGTSALAELLDVSPPAVNRMVTRLRELGYLQHEPYQGIRLTLDGEREALKHLRRQRIVESFLVTAMGFHWHEIGEDAARMARELPDMIADRMVEMAGNPQFCPHGEPIPSADGSIIPLNDMLMTEAPLAQPLIITRMRTREPDRLEYMSALGLIPNTGIEIIHAAPFNGPLQLRVGKEYRIVGHNLAEMIKVRSA